jgi:hypothetical protein
MSRKRPKAKNAPRPVRRVPARRDWKLIVLDQEPLRRDAASSCTQMMKKLKRATAEWTRFEREDQPAFNRWKAATFGTLLTTLRDLETRLGEKSTLIRQVELEMVFGGYRADVAYRRVMQARVNPPRCEEADDPFTQTFGPDAFDDFEKELLFEEALRQHMDIDPDKLDDLTYDEMFEQFKAGFFGGGPPPGEDPWAALPSDPKPEPVPRIKELYRILVRRLHPDTRADGDTAVSALWHDVQEAYAAGDVDRMEMLLAFTDIEGETAGDHTTVFQLRSLFRELRRSFNALQKSIRAARKTPAWNFAANADRSTLSKRIGSDLRAEIARCKESLAWMEERLARWAAPVRAPRQRSGRRAAQEEFAF